MSVMQHLGNLPSSVYTVIVKQNVKVHRPLIVFFDHFSKHVKSIHVYYRIWRHFYLCLTIPAEPMKLKLFFRPSVVHLSIRVTRNYHSCTDFFQFSVSACAGTYA